MTGAAAIQIAVPELTCRLPRIRKRDTRCYELAAEGVLIGRAWFLVHGEVNGPPEIGRIGHAWLEFDGWVYDPVLDQAIESEAYKSKFAALSMERYTYLEAARAISVQGHYGPWIV